MSIPAEPKFSVGDVVDYHDHTDRPQRGEVRAIEAKWGGWRDPDSPPHISYTVGHPTYANKRMYLGEKDLTLVRRAS